MSLHQDSASRISPRRKSNGTDEDVFDNIYGLHCHICTELFSTIPTSQLAPAETLCGHYVCIGCFEKFRNEEKDFNYACGLCQTNTMVSSSTRAAEGFIELLKSIKTQLIGEIHGETPRKPPKRKMYGSQSIKRITCRRCDNPFSTEASGNHPPCTSYCGHFVCVPCAEIVQTRRNDNRFQVVCQCCQIGFNSSVEKRAVAHGFMAFAAEIEEKFFETQAKRRCEIECEGCNTSIHINKARVCRTCCINEDNKFTPICLECAFEEHRELNHDVVKYIVIKNMDAMRDSEERTAVVVKTYKTIAQETSAANREEINNIVRAFNRAHNRIKKTVDSFDECALALAKLEKELENFENFSEAFVPAARSYGNSLKDIAKRLKEIFPE